MRRFVEDPAKAQREAQPEFNTGRQPFSSAVVRYSTDGILRSHKMARHNSGFMGEVERRSGYLGKVGR